MSTKDNKKPKILRTSSGTTRLTASDAEESGASTSPDSPSSVVEGASSSDESPDSSVTPDSSSPFVPADSSAGSSDTDNHSFDSENAADAQEFSSHAESTPGEDRSEAENTPEYTPAMEHSESTRHSENTGHTEGAAHSDGPVHSVAAGGTRIGGAQAAPPRRGNAPHIHPADSWHTPAGSGRADTHAEGKKKAGPRTVKLSVKKLDPWSVMKMSFLLSVAIGIATVVAVLVVWMVLQSTGVISGVEKTLSEVAGEEGAARLLSLFQLGKVMSAAVILALANIILLVALSTVFAFLYNIGATLAGGFYLTLTDE